MVHGYCCCVGLMARFHLLPSRFRSFVIIAADASAARSILVFKTDQDKIMELDDHKLLATAVGLWAQDAWLNPDIQR